MKSTLLMTVCVAGIAAGAQADVAKNLLFFGNSFTASGGGVHTLVRDIAVAAGFPMPHVFGQIVSGQTLQYHLATGTSVITSGIPSGQHWDAVVLQEYSTRPTSHPTDGNIPAFFGAANGLYQAVLNHSPEAQAVMFETWARAPGHSFYPGIWPGPADMQAELHTNYNTCSDLLNLIGTSEVARVGDAFQEGDFDISLYAGDLYHASNRGALLISLVLYGTIYDDRTTGDIDLSGVATRLGLSQTDIDYVVPLADAVLVPSPAGIAVLGGLGLMGVRRRR